MSDWLAGIALAIAVLALVLGELRARRARQGRTEPAASDWEFGWPAPGVLRVTNAGPGEARNVVVRGSADHSRGEARALRLRVGESVDVTVPALAEAWKSIAAARDRQGGAMHGDVFSQRFEAEVYWTARSGTASSRHYESTLRRAVDG
jgi:hypothetical protein